MISILGKASSSAFSLAMAWALLSSTASTIRLGTRILARIIMPSSTCSGLVRSRVSSAVMYGSHSQPLAMRVSTLPMADRAFTLPGKAAPPMPTMPASRMAWRISSSVPGRGLVTVSSLKSFSMTTARAVPAVGWGRLSMATTVPETEAWTGTHRPSASPIFWPRFTVSPTWTRGTQGAPICCCMGITTTEGVTVCSTGSWVDISLLYLG